MNRPRNEGRKLGGYEIIGDKKRGRVGGQRNKFDDKNERNVRKKGKGIWWVLELSYLSILRISYILLLKTFSLTLHVFVYSLLDSVDFSHHDCVLQS